MSDINRLFRNRIGFPENDQISFENLDTVLEKTAKSIPFENLCIMENRTTAMSKENIINKILVENEGGLCYDLNSILYLFLLENGFNVSLIRGVIFNQSGEQWNEIGKTHVANIINFNGKRYLLDTGFGGNLPLKPVPLNGEVVTSSNGEFRVEKSASEHGDYIFYMKLKHKDNDWKIGYAFDSSNVMKDVSELNEVQKIIVNHEQSPFNKKPLITKLTDKGSLTLTDTSFTEWDEGKMNKKAIDQHSFKEIVKKHFGIKSRISE